MASGELTRTAIHLVETGKSRPSLSTLRLIAARTGKPLEYFLEPGQDDVVRLQAIRESPTAMQELELAIAQERFEDAKAEGRRLLESITEPSSHAIVALLVAQAHLQTADVDEALVLLVGARKVFEASDDKWNLVECLDWQAAAAHLLEDPAALSMAHHALGLAQSLEPVPFRTLARIYGRIGSICVAQHKWRQAVDAYQHAVQAGAGLLDMSRLAKMYNDLSIAYRRIGALTQAAEYARKSVSIHELLKDRLSVGRAETNLGLILIRQKESESASAHLERALSLFVDAGQNRGRAHILLAQAELLRTRGDYAEARAKAEQAEQLSRELNEVASSSEANQILGTIAAATGDDRDADAHFAESIALLASLDLPERLATSHAEYARVLEARGDVAGALKHWRLAVAATHPEAAEDWQTARTQTRKTETA